MLSETRFRDLYQLSRELSAQGSEAAARELLFLLFDRGRDAGGYGVVRLTFVLRDLAELAAVGDAGERGVEAKRAYEGLVARRDERETKASAGDSAEDTGFAELQELVALNRALGQPDRSFTLFRKLQTEDGAGKAPSATTKALAALLRDELMPRDPRLLVEEILRQRLRNVFYAFVRAATGLRENRANSSGADSHATLEHALRKNAGQVRELAARLGAEPKTEPGSDGTDDGSGDAEAGLEAEAWKLTDPRRISSALESGSKAQTRLAGLAEEGQGVVERYGIEADNPLADDLEDRVLEVAAEVAESISELRVREDFDRREDKEKALRAVEEFAERKVREDGLLVYEVLLRLGDEETEAAERMAAWLLAYRQDEDMYLQLIQAARRAGRNAIEEDLNEEAQRVLVGG